MKRADILVAEGMMFPTGRYNPGATNNVGTGYFGNHLIDGITYYITKNKGTSANLFTDWEVHGARQGTNSTQKTPGQAFTMEWGLGQVLPLKKNFSQLLQLGLIGYDQWQVTANGGTVPIGSTDLTIPASTLPYYSVHAIGGQAHVHSPHEESEFLLQGRPRVHRLLSLCWNHDRRSVVHGHCEFQSRLRLLNLKRLVGFIRSNFSTSGLPPANHNKQKT